MVVGEAGVINHKIIMGPRRQRRQLALLLPPPFDDGTSTAAAAAAAAAGAAVPADAVRMTLRANSLSLPLSPFALRHL